MVVRIIVIIVNKMDTPSNIAAQQLKYEKLTSELLSRQQALEALNQQKNHIRWELFIIGILFFIFAKYVMLRTQFKPVFDLFNQSKDKIQMFQCSNNVTANPWNIVLGVAYPFLRNLVEEPLSPDEAWFLWMAITSNWIPTQTQIDQCTACNGLGLTPLSYLCGNILSVWNTATGKTLSDIQNSPETTPWQFYLSGSNPRSQILDNTNNLQVLVTQGLWGFAKFVGGTAQNIYNQINDKEPPPASCSTVSQVVGTASTGATFAMTGAAFGPAGAIIGGAAGLVLGGLQQNDQCGSSSSCIIM